MWGDPPRGQASPLPSASLGPGACSSASLASPLPTPIPQARKRNASLCWGGRGSYHSQNTSSDVVAWQPCRTLGAEALHGAVGLGRHQPRGSLFPWQMGFVKEIPLFSRKLGILGTRKGQRLQGRACPAEQNSCALQQSPQMRRGKLLRLPEGRASLKGERGSEVPV